MGQPRPTRRMYGYFADHQKLPREIRGQNLFYSTEDEYLYCTAAGKAVRLSDAEALLAGGLVVRDEQEMRATRQRGKRQEGKGGRSRRMVILLSIGCVLMVLANIYAVLMR